MQKKKRGFLCCPIHVTRVMLQLVVIKSIIFNQIIFCLCHIIQEPILWQHPQDGLLKSNIVNNILNSVS